MTRAEDSDVEAVFAAERGRLFGLAYRMLGTAADAEEVVAEAFARLTARGQHDEPLQRPGAWLTTVVTRLALDRLASARRQRERYVGPWLPEPIPTGATADPVVSPAPAVDPAEAVDAAASLTLAFLVVLDELTPLERATFLLHDVFGHPFEDVAAMLERTPAAVRQTAVRARRHLEDRGPGRQRPDGDVDEVVDAFLAACVGGPVEEVVALLAPDVRFTSDGGGVATALPHPVAGAATVARILTAFVRTGARRGATAVRTELNGGPAVVVREDGVTTTALLFEVVDGRVAQVFGVRNPAKLGAATAAAGRDLTLPDP